MDYGSTFTGMSVGSSAMVSCTMSDDGSIITATNDKKNNGWSVTSRT